MIPAEIRDIIFLDIETVAHKFEYSQLDERLKTQWGRRASYLKRDSDLTDEEVYRERAGIYAEFGRIVCIGVGKFAENEHGELVLMTKAYYGHDEKQILLGFKSMIEKRDPNFTKLCAHNGKEFDFPYMCRRMLVNCIPLPNILSLAGKKPWEVMHLDTMEMWKFGDYKNYTSLDLLAAIFNIPTSKSDIDGSQVNEIYHLEGGLERIKDYCIRDVIVLAQLFLRMKCITPENEIIIQYA